MKESEKIKAEFYEALVSYDRPKIEDIMEDLISRFSTAYISDSILAPTLEKIGEGWEEGTVSLSHLFMSGRICEELVKKLMPVDESDKKNHPKIAIAVIEDWHSLGKRMVCSVLRASGYDVIDYGIGLSVTDVMERAIKEDVKILLLSALMLPSALLIEHLTKLLKINHSKIKVVVGGAPFCFDNQLWEEVGADAMGSNASDAIGIIERLIEEMK